MRYLQSIGIDIWRFRTPDSYGYFRYDLFDHQNRQAGILLADAILRNKIEAQLVEKIARATRKQIRGGFRFGCFESSNEFGKCAIFLGSQVSEFFMCTLKKSTTIIRSYSPADLLRNGKLKVQIWNDLKVAIQLMNA
ncbi:hypothetical protein EGQ50_02220 [Coxiella endosymbiont of Amblyomma sculptum]|uniref:hypothetical protein n=1 Tax=Coxiella endosymbiont of Amblyomma sculptum TaxID=2487929 RepID=UPI00132EF276|nr:hypothetical protein [Coxiella endosymbiont of Amblyomma sculptum]QHG92544.1 hypothetical protein EGQ50_02220 [Coxiella endosymbiont of Amblyomma sculptum]